MFLISKDLHNLWTAKIANPQKPLTKTAKTRVKTVKTARISPQLLLNPHIFYFSSLLLISSLHPIPSMASPTQTLPLPPKPPHLQLYQGGCHEN